MKPPIATVVVAYGAEELVLQADRPYRWWQIELRAETNLEATPLVQVRALTSEDPLTEARGSLRFARYQLRIPETGETLEFRDVHTGQALLPAWHDFERYFVPAPVVGVPRQAGAPQTCEYLGQILTLRESRSVGDWEDWAGVKRLDLDREALVGTGRPFKDAEGHRLTQTPERRDYTYVPFDEADYQVMIDAGMNLFTVKPEQEQWVRSAPVFYIRAAAGQPKLRYPADLYRANYMGSVMFMDEPSILMVDDPNVNTALQYFSDAAALIEKRTRTTYQSNGSYGAYNLEKALQDAGVNLGDMRLMQEDYPSWETYYDTAFYQMKGGGMGIVHEGRYQLRQFDTAVERVSGEPWTHTSADLLKYHYAFLRGAARPFNKFWGTAIYGQCDTNIAPQALTLAFDMGARYFWFWTSDHEHHVPWPEQLELARNLKRHMRDHPRPSIYGPASELDAVIALPNGYFLSLEDLWWVRSLHNDASHQASKAYDDFRKRALAEIHRCQERCLDFDVTIDDGHPLTQYRRIIRP
jgi:hypothetical protein